jgi:hypothetical protein
MLFSWYASLQFDEATGTRREYWAGALATQSRENWVLYPALLPCTRIHSTAASRSLGAASAPAGNGGHADGAVCSARPVAYLERRRRVKSGLLPGWMVAGDVGVRVRTWVGKTEFGSEKSGEAGCSEVGHLPLDEREWMQRGFSPWKMYCIELA